MKSDIHPESFVTQVTCSCGNAFETRSTSSGGAFLLEVCDKCHPFFTGKHKIVTTGQVEKFRQRFAGFSAMQKPTASEESGSPS